MQEVNPDNPYRKGQVLLFDKPETWTSFQVVKLVKTRLKYDCGLKKIKVGHAGTLDPLATGLLIVCTGKKTKEIQDFMGQEKVYEGSLVLGATRPSVDRETEIDQEFPVDHIGSEMIEKVRQSFLGETDQFPPSFSAVKKDGKRAYELAREGKEVDLKSRKVVIKEFGICPMGNNEYAFRVVCSKGTYIRSLVRDFGEKLNSGAWMNTLRRTGIGSYSVQDAIHPKSFAPSNDQGASSSVE